MNELDPEAFRALAHEAVDLAADYLASLPDGPAYRRMTPDTRSRLSDMQLPASGLAAGDLLNDVRDAIMPYPMGNGHPRFFGWVNSPPSAIGIVAELLAATMNPSCAGGDHAAIYVEHATTRWLMELLGFPTEGSMGILVSGGSMASLTGLAAARQRACERDGWSVRVDGLHGRPPFTMYVSTETHTTVIKAAELMGIGSSHVRVIPVDADYRMNTRALSDAIAADRAAGLRPFAVVGSAGTVNTGAVDPLNDIAGICARDDLWFHIDAAYGGPGILDDRVAPLYAGLERADSIALDPHKWLSVPVESGCAIVGDRELLRRTFSLVPPYLQVADISDDGRLPWYAEYGFQQTRGFRALKTWMTLAHAGRDGVAAIVRNSIDRARELAEIVDAHPQLELLVAPTLSIVCFRYRPDAAAHAHDRDPNVVNRELMERLQADGDTFVTQAVLREVFALRANVLHYGTTRDDLEVLVDAVVRTGDVITGRDAPR